MTLLTLTMLCNATITVVTKPRRISQKYGISIFMIIFITSRKLQMALQPIITAISQVYEKAFPQIMKRPDSGIRRIWQQCSSPIKFVQIAMSHLGHYGCDVPRGPLGSSYRCVALPPRVWLWILSDDVHLKYSHLCDPIRSFAIDYTMVVVNNGS